MNHIRVGVLRGGPSSEYDVSLKTGASVMRNLHSPFEPIDIFIDKEGQWHISGCPVTPADASDRVDVFFNALHGAFGEDGQLQHTLDQIGMPYTGSQRLASAIAMHKMRTKERLAESGIRMPRHRRVHAHEDLGEVSRDIFHSMFLPLVVKPANGGSSLGVTIVQDFPSLTYALETAFAHGDDVLVEEFVRGKEATCGVIEGFRGEQRYTLPPIEIRVPQGSFFDFEAKYDGETEEICPGNFSKKEREELQHAARTIHDTLGLRHYSRSDFIVSPRGVYFLETNTLPGLTEQSLFPKSIEAIGSTLPEFLAHVIHTAYQGR